MFIPRQYQRLGAYFLARRRGALLGDEVGLGKTATSILACRLIKARRVLVIAPLRHKEFWCREIIKVERGVARDPIVTAVEYTECGPRVIVGERIYDIAHYEQFRDSDKLDKRKRPLPAWQCEGYLATQYDAVIVDEAHRIKNRKAQRSRWIKKLKTEHKWALTGSPIAERPDDLFSLLHWFDRKEFGSYWTFVETYCDIDHFGYHPKILGLRFALDMETGRSSQAPVLRALAHRVSPYVLVRKREDVGIELPPFQVIPVPIVMAQDQADFYKGLKTAVAIDLVETFGDPDVWDLSEGNTLLIHGAGARYVRLQQAASAPTVFKPGISNAKLDWLEDYVNSGGAPALILARFKHTVAVIQAALDKLGAGDQGHIVGTYDMLSESHNFQHLNTMIAWDVPLSRLQWEQAQGRIRRPGQEKPQFYFQLVAEGTVNHRGWLCIDKKQTEIDLILDWLREIKNDR
ncbi:MAG: hypothetical protein KJ604_20170 [Gammaproteobacteria bacterium]|nr:hypothetical protein [Gammaproteobacteria bacterium]